MEAIIFNIVALVIAGAGLAWRIRVNYQQEINKALEKAEERLNKRIDEIQQDIRKSNGQVERSGRIIAELKGRFEESQRLEQKGGNANA